MSINYIPRYESGSGGELTGSDGSENRTYTLTNVTNILDNSLNINAGRTALILDTDYSLSASGGIVTFLIPIDNPEIITYRYTTTETTSDASVVTADILRTYLQFDVNDYPTPDDMAFFISISNIQVGLDLDSSDTDTVYLATLLLSRYNVMNALATRALSKGYIQINAEGRTITKAYAEMKEIAEVSYDLYLRFLDNFRTEADITTFWNDANLIDPDTKQEVLDRFTGTQNLMDLNDDTRFSYGFRQRRR